MSVSVMDSGAVVWIHDSRVSVITAGFQGPPGTGTFVFNETPTGTIDGVNDTFTVANAPSAGGMLSVNGQVLTPGADYDISGDAITFDPEALPQPGDIILITYAY